MSRKIYIDVTTRLIVRADDGVSVDEVISDMDYNFTSRTDGANIEETEIKGHEVTDSK